MKPRLTPSLIIGSIVAAGVIFVAFSLQRPAPPAYAPTAPGVHVSGDSLIGPLIYTIDASAPDRWQYFSFARGSLGTSAEPGWDLAFRRFHIIANGGAGFDGRGGIIDLGAVSFESLTEAPAGGYAASSAGKDSSNAAIARWYDYSWTSHVLKPKPHVWVARTAGGRYAKLRLLSYYCPGARPGCVTFQYVYQGSGGRAFAP
ncbi:MAG: HmuY family protein [Gemmatimonadota bacterium]